MVYFGVRFSFFISLFLRKIYIIFCLDLFVNKSFNHISCFKFIVKSEFIYTHKKTLNISSVPCKMCPLFSIKGIMISIFDVVIWARIFYLWKRIRIVTETMTQSYMVQIVFATLPPIEQSVFQMNQHHDYMDIHIGGAYQTGDHSVSMLITQDYS